MHNTVVGLLQPEHLDDSDAVFGIFEWSWPETKKKAFQCAAQFLWTHNTTRKKKKKKKSRGRNVHLEELSILRMLHSLIRPNFMYCQRSNTSGYLRNNRSLALHPEQ